MKFGFSKSLLYLFLITISPAILTITRTVTSAADDGSAGTLRQVISVSNPGDVIIFAIGAISSAQTITLNPAFGTLVIAEPLTIQGPNHGGGIIRIDGGNLVNIGFQINFFGSGTIIRNLTLQNFTGDNGADGNPGQNGEDAVGIFLNNANVCEIFLVTFDGNFIGGNGGNGTPVGAGGAGGLAAAVRILNGSNNQISAIINGNYEGGDGGIGGNIDSLIAPGVGGNGGRAGGIIVDGAQSINNRLSGNLILSTTFVGGNGGKGGDTVAGEIFTGAVGGNGGKAAGIIIDQMSQQNQIISNNISANSTGGNGGNGGNANGGVPGNGGNGGDAANLIIDNNSNLNTVSENILLFGTFTAGIAGNGGIPNGSSGIGGIIANVLVTNNSVNNPILTNSIQGNVTILGINLVNNGNNEQQEPTLNLAQFCPSTREMFIDGELENTVNGSTYLIQFFDNALSVDPNQGRTFIGQFEIIGNGATVIFSDSFVVPAAISITPGDNISSTATLSGLSAPTDTSEFSNNVAVVFLIPATADNQTLQTCQNDPINGFLTGSSPLFEIVSGPSNGTLILINPTTGQFIYTPNLNFFGVDSFQFIAGADEQCPSFPATVTITVFPELIVKDHKFTTCTNQKLTILPPGLLEGTQLLPQQVVSLEIVGRPSFGLVVLHPDGSFVYTPRLCFVGQDVFVFRVVPDPTSPCPPSNEATVFIDVQPCCSFNNGRN